MEFDFIGAAEKLERKSQKLLQQLNPSFLADNCVKENLLKNIRLLRDIPPAYNLLQKKCGTKQSDCSPKKSATKQSYSCAGWDLSSISPEVQNWRQKPTYANYDKIPLSEKKEIFDYFFRYDVYGALRKDDTVHLSRGVNDPNYFFPPAFVKVGLNFAAENDWFGYSDSLGHRETRTRIAELESVRRNQKKYSFQNAAVVQGGTEGLNSILSYLSKHTDKKKCIALTPTYAPIIDDIGYYFTPDLYAFNPDYSFSMEKIINAINAETGVVLFSIPHNPGGFANIKPFLPELQKKCAQYGAYLIVDEIMFDSQISPYLDPIKYKNLIVLTSYSKMYNIPGLKLGHILADKSFIDRFYRHASTTYGSPPSFLYYTASLIAFYEKAFWEKKRTALPEELITKTSQKNLLLQEFKIWRETINLHTKFQKFAILALIKHYGLEHFFEIFGLQDASPNIVIRAKNSKHTAYELFLRILTGHNISVIPIECFVPPANWPADLRFTLAVNPSLLVDSFCSVLKCIHND